MPNTPKKYKGFAKLPEQVQKRMDPEAAMKYMEGGAVKKYMGGGRVMKYGYGGNVEKDGVMYEHDPEPQKASMKGGTGGGHSRGGGAAISGTRFSGVK